MKKIILFLVLLLPVVSLAQTPLPATITLTPDSIWNDGATTAWEPDGTCFYQYNGFAFVFIFCPLGGITNRTSYAYIYLFNKDHRNEPLKPYMYKHGQDSINYIKFGYPSEDVATNTGWILGQTFAFEFNQRLWYFQHIHSSQDFSSTKHSFECFAQLPVSTSDTVFHYYDYFETVPDLIKYGAFQMDSSLFFISRNTANSANEWFIEEYSFQSGTNRFSYTTNYKISNLPNDTRLGGYFKVLDSLGNESVMLNTYTPYIDNSSSSMVNIGKIVPVRSSGKITGFDYSSLVPVNYPFYGISPNASTIIKGSARGSGRTTDRSPGNSDRFFNVYIGGMKNSNGNYPVYFNECYLQNDGRVVILNNGAVNLPAAASPYEISKYNGWTSYKEFNIKGFQELRPGDFSNNIAGIDGFQQYIWVLYPDKNKHFDGGSFLSDNWRLDDSKIVHNKYPLSDTIHYTGVSSMWTLVGILDGAPPCSMNWEAWDSTTALFLHDPDPTELLLNISNSNQTQITNTIEDQWSHGNNMKIGLPFAGMDYSVSEEYKYSNAFKNTYSSGTKVTTTYTYPFSLTPETQETAYKLWSVPSLTRFTYQLYPWWDNLLQYPVPNSIQYLIRSNGNMIVTEPVPLSGLPFLVTDPNGDSLLNWTVSRRPHFWDALQTGIAPILNPVWQDPYPGGTFTVEYSSENSSLSNSSSSYSAEASVGIKIPEIFELSLTGSYEVNYSTDIKTTTIFGREVEVSLKNLEFQNWGVNTSSLFLSVYWFKNDGTPWWYFDDLDGQKPWYLAYISVSSKLKIEALTPRADETIPNSDLVFSWTAVEGTFSKYTLFISTSSGISPGNVVYRLDAGIMTTAIPAGFNGLEGKEYFWAVMGETAEGEIAWSKPSSFLIPETVDQDLTPGNMTVKLYPNPGMDGQVNFYIKTAEPGIISFMLYGPDGKFILEREYNAAGGELVIGRLPSLLLRPGIYFARFKSSSEVITRKVVITGNY